MTGQKNRFKTTEKLWNLDDKQLATPKHDAMVLWLMDTDNLQPLLEGFDDFKLDNFRSWEGHFEESVKEGTFFKIQSEVPLQAQNGFINGYADLIIRKENIKNVEQIYGNRYMYDYSWFSCLIEIKPYIDSFGAVLRQLNSYKRFWGNKYDKKIIFNKKSENSRVSYRYSH